MDENLRVIQEIEEVEEQINQVNHIVRTPRAYIRDLQIQDPMNMRYRYSLNFILLFRQVPWFFSELNVTTYITLF